MQLYLGVDGGGTSTRACIADAAGRVLGVGTAGPSNVRIGAAAAWDAVLTASRAAIAAAGLADDALRRSHAGLGLAGAFAGPARDAFLALPSPFARMQLETDAHIACLGAHGGAPGAIVIAGTGSVAHVWDGKISRQIGGWGFPISDGGSGAWIGLEAVRLALQSLEQPLASELAVAVLAELSGSGEAAVLWASAASPAAYAAVAPRVFAAAAAGDAAAEKILQAAATHIDRLIAAAVLLQAPRISLLGGLADALTPLLAAASRARLVAPLGDALDGALRLIRERAP
jgi:glucosamine kinase